MSETANAQPSTVSSTRDGAVATIIISNPARRNAMADSMWGELRDVLHDLQADPAVRVCVMRGAGERAFVSGADISRLETRIGQDDAQAAHVERSAGAWAALDNFPKPMIAMVRGFCMGAGMGLASKCDLRIAAKDAVFGVPAGRMGLAYTDHLVRDLTLLAGPKIAKRLLFTAERLDAAEAFRVGIVDYLCEVDDLEARTAELANRIAANAPLSLRAAKAAINHFTRGEPDKGVLARNAQICLASADHAEGVRAFLEKRTPQFTGE